jgi:hypothetical protein
MKKSLLISLVVCSNSFAQTFHDWDNASKLFNAGSTEKTVAITWKPVDNVQQVCDIEGKNRGHGRFGYSVNSCAFWSADGLQCTIITPKKTNMHLLGHEVRHCFQGNWHK